ncbi:MAG: excinuclease ABC subunit UvrA [Thermodesulfovibrionia bacterium]|nr:excinuclease ABC subunit UvrA [Thermodesulfovibrionia bacterium]
MLKNITIRKARVHNLKNIDLSIPRDRFTVITGPSGSGKSSLAFDTIYAEGQRRYVESLSAYARQFLEQLQKPDVDSIEGLSPSIAVEQKTVAKNLRSTVGTITKIYDYLKVVYTRIGKLNCYKCGSPIATQGISKIVESIAALPKGTRIQVLSPVVIGRKGEHKKELFDARKRGFIRARIDGEIVDITKDVKLGKHKRHSIDIVIDRLIIKQGIERHLSTAISHAIELTDVVIINNTEDNKDLFFSMKLACPKCGINYPEITPRFFSFNSPFGACPECRGLGYMDAEEEEDDTGRLNICTECKGMRLRQEALGVTLNGLNIGELVSKPISEIRLFIAELKLTDMEETIISKVIKEIKERLNFLDNVGLGYISLNRPALTLSGGEIQRIRLATQIGSSLSGVLYIFDEPSIGLHPRDCGRLIHSLLKLRDLGNTVIVVEHDEDTIRSADHIIDMGPGAGVHGGYVVAEGDLKDITANERSLTGLYLRGKMSIPVPAARRRSNKSIKVKGASEFNLKKIDVEFPLGIFNCVTGVSGSGKSTLVLDILYNALAKRLYSSKERPGLYKSIEGIDLIDKVINIDQSPLGRSPRSNPATYTGIFTLIRNLFSQAIESKVRGYKPNRFSFNVTGGRCEACKGDGLMKVTMHFLPDVYVLCEACKGARYNRETLDIKYKGRNISEVLNMTVSQALDFFGAIPQLKNKLATIEKVGLGYIALGQSATTLSGGEAQRVKLSKELSRRATGKTLYILDEPTTGLHFVDIHKLLEVLRALVDAGNTVIVIEHNLEVIKSADHIIDLGPEGGKDGGRVVAKGTPEEVANNPKSHTGAYLKEKLFVKKESSV